MATECPNCQMNQQLTASEIEALIAEQLAVEIDLVPLEIKEGRLKVCHSCPKLVNQTCLHCGCFVGFRASLAHKRCPVNKW